MKAGSKSETEAPYRQRRTTRRLLLGALLLGGSLLLGSTGCKKEPTVHQTEKTAVRPMLTKVSTRIKWLAYASYIGTYVARDWGFWRQRGLDVEIFEGGPQIDATKLVAAGANDFGIASGDQILVARARGLPVVAFAAEMQESPCAFMVHADSGITSPRDFAGKRIRIIPGHNTEIEYRAAMRKLGLDMKAVKETVNFSELKLFLAHEVDIEPIYLNNQPATVRKMGVPFRTIRLSDYGIRSYGNVYFTSERMIREKPQVVQKFLEGLLEGWKGAFADRNRALDTLLAAAPSLDREVERVKLAETEPLMHRDDGRTGWMDRERWQEIADFLLDGKLVEKPLDVDDAFTMQFLETIYGKGQEQKQPQGLKDAA